MEIRRFKENSFVIKGKKETMLIDPDREGEKKNKARLVLLTEAGEDFLRASSSDKVYLAGPGEYEIGGVEIHGIAGDKNKTCYIVNVDGLKVVYLPKMDEPLSDKKIENIDSADILLAPVGSSGSSAMVKDICRKWGVNYLIPYGEEGGEAMKRFLDGMDEEGLSPVEELKVAGVEELPEGLEVVILSYN